ncbi:MAG: AMP-binding protein, partial [Anaerolineae bacterium]|nr:AMP-binding protein [Anaerolineae bacterium]
MVTYADRPWIKHYDAGVPASLKPYPEITVHDYLRQAARKYPDRTALIMSTELPLFGFKEHRMTYAELDRASDALAAALLDRGLVKGGRVALVMPNTTAFVIAYYATLKAGGVVSAVNPTYPAAKMQHQIADCDAEFAVVTSMFYRTINEIRAETPLKHVIVSSIKDYLHPLAAFLFGLTQEKKGGHRVESLHAGDFWLGDLL